MSPLLEVKRLGQSIWLDNLSRTMLRDGGLKRMIEKDGVSGVTSNPSIFHKAVAADASYRDDLTRLRSGNLDPESRYEALVIPDIQAACDLLRLEYVASLGNDGYVSLEVSPRLAYNEEATVHTALRLRRAVARDNLLIKVPATPPGVRAFERLVAEGINVNVTLMFSLTHVRQVTEAYLRGLQRRRERGGELHAVKAVASLFLSRVDTLVDLQLEGIGRESALQRRGHTGVALAKLAYQYYRQQFHGPAFAGLAAAGARRQYLLWGSTGTKNPNYSDVLYVEPLIGSETVNTLPDATLSAFRDHGKAALTLTQGVQEAEAHFIALQEFGIDADVAGQTLQAEGVRLFDTAYTQLLELMS